MAVIKPTRRPATYALYEMLRVYLKPGRGSYRLRQLSGTAVLAGFAARITAQRERTHAELPPEPARRASAQLADLINAGALAAALTLNPARSYQATGRPPGPPPPNKNKPRTQMRVRGHSDVLRHHAWWA